MEKSIEQLKAIIENEPARSAWSKGVKVYVAELLEELNEAIEQGYFDAEDIAAPNMLRKQLLNGAQDWMQYSYGGCSLIYDGDIAERLCSPSELKRTRDGERSPNAKEEWLDVQARALCQAAQLVMRAAKKAGRDNE
jgi:hypothetical protein